MDCVCITAMAENNTLLACNGARFLLTQDLALHSLKLAFHSLKTLCGEWHDFESKFTNVEHNPVFSIARGIVRAWTFERR